MFERLPATGIQDRLSDAIYRWRRIADWPEAEATVWACVWAPNVEMPSEGTYRVSFSYPTKGGIQGGTIVIGGVEKVWPYVQGDTFALRYNPKRPSVYYYASETSRLGRMMLILGALALGAVAALIAVSLFR